MTQLPLPIPRTCRLCGRPIYSDASYCGSVCEGIAWQRSQRRRGEETIVPECLN